MDSTKCGSKIILSSGNHVGCDLSWRSRFHGAAVVCIAFLFSLLLQPSAKAAESGALLSFLDIESIKGDSDRKGHKDEIETLGFSTGVDLALPATGGGGGGASKPQFFEVVVSKNVDRASPLLFITCATGKHVQTATLTMARATPNGPVDFFKIILSDVVVSRVETKGMTGSGGALSEEVALSFGKVQWSITTFNAKGEPAAVITRGFDLVNNRTL